jgi:hypothetical protein
MPTRASATSGIGCAGGGYWDRQRFRRNYEGKTLCGSFGIPRPVLSYEARSISACRQANC